jgi:hypothetical protein
MAHLLCVNKCAFAVREHFRSGNTDSATQIEELDHVKVAFA